MRVFRRVLTAVVALTTGFSVVMLPVSPAMAAPGWVRLPGAARDIGVGANGAAWIVGTNEVSADGYGIWQWTGSTWTSVPGAARFIDVDRDGRPWVTNNKDQIYRRDRSTFVQLPGGALDIGVGAGGTAWVTGTNAVSADGFGIWQWTGSNWTSVPGAAFLVDVDRDGRPWVINAKNQIYRWDGSAFVRIPGAGRDIGIGAIGSPWVVGTDNSRSLYHWNGSTWDYQAVPCPVNTVSAGRQGEPWITCLSGAIYRWAS